MRVRSTVLASRGALVCLLLFVCSITAVADRPTAADLLPKETVVAIRIVDCGQFIEKFRETAVGRMARDEQLKPLIGQLYGEAVAAFAELDETGGVSLGELLAIPQGEAVLAAVVPEEGQAAWVAILDVGNQVTSTRKLIGRAEQAMADQGVSRTTETFSGTKLTVFDTSGDGPDKVVLFEKDATFVLATDLEVAKNLLRAWNGEGDAEPLAKNERYVSIMNRCRVGKDEPPQATWFVDPIELARISARGNLGAQAGLAILPSLGLDGVEGVGGSITLGSGQFDTVMHVHLLLDTPRNGIVEMLALDGGDVTPERWVPGSAASYMTLHWDTDTTYEVLGRLYDSFQGEDALAAAVQSQLSEPMGVDFPGEVLDAMDGRFTLFTWFEPPHRLNARRTLLGVKLKDAKGFKATLDKIIEKQGELFAKASYGGVEYFKVQINTPPGQDEAGQDLRPEPQRPGREVRIEASAPEPCVAILGDYLVLADRPTVLHEAIVTKSDASKSLAEQLDFKLIAGKIRRHSKASAPGWIVFDRPEEGMRAMYELVANAENQRQWSAEDQSNRFLRTVGSALGENPLPPFAVLAKYLAPSGGMVTNDETGFHYMGFSLRRK